VLVQALRGPDPQPVPGTPEELARLVAIIADQSAAAVDAEGSKIGRGPPSNTPGATNARQ